MSALKRDGYWADFHETHAYATNFELNYYTEFHENLTRFSRWY
jgi:hypothetical protein